MDCAQLLLCSSPSLLRMKQITTPAPTQQRHPRQLFGPKQPRQRLELRPLYHSPGVGLMDPWRFCCELDQARTLLRGEQTRSRHLTEESDSLRFPQPLTQEWHARPPP